MSDEIERRYRSLASAVLLQTIMDSQAVGGADKVSVGSYTVFRAELNRFIESGWCESLCEYIGIDRDKYADKYYQSKYHKVYIKRQ